MRGAARVLLIGASDSSSSAHEILRSGESSVAGEAPSLASRKLVTSSGALSERSGCSVLESRVEMESGQEILETFASDRNISE